MKSDKQKRQTTLFLAKLMLLFMVTGLYGVVWFEFYAENLYQPFYFRGGFVIIFIFMILYANFSRLYGVYDLRISRISDLVYSNVIATFVTAFVMYCILILLERKIPNIFPMVLFMVVADAIGIPWAIYANHLTNKVLPVRRVLIVYDNEVARRNGEHILRNIPWRYKMIGQIHIRENIEETIEEINLYKPYGVMLCGIHSTPRNTLLKYCIEHDIPIY